MAQRVFVMCFSYVQPTNTPGVFKIYGNATFVDDDTQSAAYLSAPNPAVFDVDVTFTDNIAQIETTIKNALITLGASFGFVSC